MATPAEAVSRRDKGGAGAEVIVQARNITQAVPEVVAQQTGGEQSETAPPQRADELINEDTLGSFSRFLTEQHTYLAQSTLGMVESMRAEIAAEYEERLVKRETEHETEIASLENALNDSQRQLSIAQHSLERILGDRETVNWSTASRFLAGKEALNKKTVFYAWFKEAFTAKAERLLCRVADKRYFRSILSRVMSAWIRFIFGSKDDRVHRRAEARLKSVSSQIITRYEAELEKLRSIISTLKAQVQDGHRRRCLLEDELRRTLLKGMVSMNMEALSIFSTNAADDRLAAATIDHQQEQLVSTIEQTSLPSPAVSGNLAPGHNINYSQSSKQQIRGGGDDLLSPLPRSIAPQPSSSSFLSLRPHEDKLTFN
mmetsp:Transcript_19054/g.24695  ORF Transcript_19054/g.24695 Transcript_19054/m.24695 type:complete len:372 (+) Transcript_19054:32-1147(+)|eukprot:CAMPEP_0197315216 /NCGR_PEP_ID=MMETSP0891-20130614/37229_1 /TAXON_ID=44058 ORGANISM="Aureoumbra lagunensis, Strain CCMP1510" /NCGR_SAMPLE_ID=MMETSP0891 /ASSEMBLY_ACC=CAM_ASM_000534 /LENGTH=371 /DNA_ID=CAMNT_0042804059 /DNA_START=15 /DNA_END=1127 /DNA_ORIENTATION=-